MEQSAKVMAALPDATDESEDKLLSSMNSRGNKSEAEETECFTSLSEASCAAKLDVCNSLAGLLYDVDPDKFEVYFRHERRVNEARQLGIYLANICLGVSYEEIALPARRDRSTVRYSVERVEDRRENPQFDMALVSIETFISCLLDRASVEMIKSGVQVDFDRITWTPHTGNVEGRE